MKKCMLLLGGIAVTSVALLGQDSNQAWSGLLVSAACQDTGKAGMNAGKTAREQNATYEHAQNEAAGAQRSSKDRDQMARTTDRGTPVEKTADDALNRTTTPPVDDQGTRGKATINNTPAKDAANRVGDDDQATGKLDASCRVGQTTKAFALRLDDGSLMRFDDASNAKIVQQVQSGDRLLHKTKIFRAKVKGSLQGGVISINTIQI